MHFGTKSYLKSTRNHTAKHYIPLNLKHAMPEKAVGVGLQ